MTALREAAQQALEFCESVHGGCTDSNDGTVEAITIWCPELIEALRAALKQEEEASAWLAERKEYWRKEKEKMMKETNNLRTALAQQAEPVDADAAYQRWLGQTHAPALRRMDSQGAFAAGWQAALAQQAEPQDAELSAALGWPGGISEPVLDRKTLLRQVADLRSALAQQAEPVEPVAWVSPNALAWELYQSEKVLKLTRTRQEEYGFTEPLYTAPPRRPSLTEEEIEDIYLAWDVTPGRRIADLVRAVERAHEIKERT